MIDLRSDTVTRPTAGMRAAIAAAAVGDEQMREDPTVNELQERVAELLGQERAIFLPTATMANQIALKLHGRPGDVLIAEEHSHVLDLRVRRRRRPRGVAHGRLAGAWRAALTVAQVRAAAVDRRGRRRSAPRRARRSRTPTTSPAAACGRSTSSTPWSQSRAPAGVGVHLDGARLMNAAVALGVPPAAIGSRVDTVTLCLSKGLGCPLGALLAGPADLMEHRLAAEVPLRRSDAAGGDDRRRRPLCTRPPCRALALDHERARRLAEGWHADGVPVELDRVETNFVQIDTSRLDVPRAEALALLREAGVGLSPTYTPSHIRAVTHLDLDDADIDRALVLVPAVLGSHVYA